MAKGILTKTDVSVAKLMFDKSLLKEKAVELDNVFLKTDFEPFLRRLLSDPRPQIAHILSSNSKQGLLRSSWFKWPPLI